MAKKAVKRRVPAKKRGSRILPTKMSKLIEIALADLKRAEKAEDMIIDMGTWLNPESEIACRLGTDGHGEVIKREKACVACLAGSVMRYSLKINKFIDDPMQVKGNGPQLAAINELREGDVTEAASSLGMFSNDYDDDDHELRSKFNALDRSIPEYDRDDTKPFHKAMEKLQKDLVKAGL